MLQQLARACYRQRRLVVLAWIGILVAATAVSSAFGGELRNDLSLPGSESQAASDLLETGGFVGAAGERGQIVFAASPGVSDPDVQRTMEDFFAAVRSDVGGVEVMSPYDGGGQIAPDGSVAFADVEVGDVPLDTAQDRAAEVAALRDSTSFPQSVQVELGGELFYEESGFSSEGIGLIAAVVILLVAFGSVLAMGLPILAALFGIGCGMAIVMLAAHVLDVPDFAPAAVAMVTIGVGIDYALVLVTRYREGLAAGRDPEAAVVRAVDTAGRAVLFAGTAVVIALLGLLVVGLAATRSLAVAVSSGVLMAMLASLTLLPAMLGFAGRHIDRLSVGRRRLDRGGHTSVWYRWSRVVQRRPGPVAAVGFTVLIVLTAPVVSMRLGFGDAGNRPDSDTVRRAYDLVSESFGAGFNGPIFLAVDLPGDVSDDVVLARLDAAMANDSGVASATPAVVGDGDDVAVVQVFPATSPQDETTSDLVHRLRDDVLPRVVIGSDAQVLVGGPVAGVTDASDLQASRMPLFIGAVLIMSFVVLMAVFRSVAVALKAIVLNVLSIGAAYGVVVAVFQWGWGAGVLGLGEPGPIEAWAPMMLFAILFGLSMDYEVFLLTRMKEEYDRTGDNATAVADGLARTARLITAAAAIMICVFGGFVLSADRALQLFGLGLATAILVDVTIVRLLLVPATMELLGDRNWWLPGWLDRLLPRLTVDQQPEPVAELTRTPTLTNTAGRS
jgi:putative drug exporter of the RND superfamily